MLEQLTAADFRALPDNRIDARFGDAETRLEIVEVRELSASARPVTPFALTLRDTGAKHAMPQGVYAFQHPLHGSIELFIVPIGPDREGMCYEVIFN